MTHEVATTHRPHVLRARVAFKMATNNSGKPKAEEKSGYEKRKEKSGYEKRKEKSGYEKRKEKRQCDLKDSSTAQGQTCLTNFSPPKLRFQ